MKRPDWQSLTDVPADERILRLMAYFDIFSHPLSEEEIRRMAFGAAVELAVVRDALGRLTDAGRMHQQGDHYFLPGRADGVPLRQEKAARARALWAEVPDSVRLLASFPFVRGLSITGTLAKDAVGEDADIDFVVFTAQDRVWVCRTLISLARRLMPVEQRERCCANVFLSEHSLGYDQQTPYVAAEIGLSRPVLNPALGARFFEENRWLRAFLPGMDAPPPPPVEVPHPAPTRLTRLAESLLSGRAGDQLEALLPHAWDRFWALKYAQLNPGDRGRRFRIRRDLSTNHYNDFQARVLERYRARLEELGLTPTAGAATP